MTATAAARVAREHPAAAVARGVLHVIDSHRGKLTPELLNTIRGQIVDALELLTEPDPFTQRVGMVLLAIKQSTRVESRKINGRYIDRVTVTDQVLYGWAIAQLHQFAT